MEAAIIGSSLIGGLAQRDAARRAGNIQADAARQAAQSQLQAAREANQLQYGMYQQAMANQAPYMRGGQSAFAALMGGMGLGGMYNQPARAGIPGTPPPAQTAGLMRPAVMEPGRARPLEAGGPSAAPQEMMYNPDTGAPMYAMPVTGGAPAGPAAAPGTGMFDPTQLPPGLQPRNYGASPEEMAAAAGQYAGRFTETFKPSDITLDPSYQFRVEQGLRALKASRAATGMLQTGQGLQDIVNYGQQAGSQEYQAAYDRFMRNQETAYNRLAGLAGIGQAATNVGTQAGLGTGQQIGQNIMAGQGAASNYLTGGAASQAAGVVGGANALTGAMQSGLQNWMGMQYLNRPQIGYQAAGPMSRTSVNAPIIPSYWDQPGGAG